MAVEFNQVVKHGRIQFFPGVSVAFEDPRADAYFTTLGWASESSETPVHTYSADEVAIDPETRVAETGALVIEQEG